MAKESEREEYPDEDADTDGAGEWRNDKKRDKALRRRTKHLAAITINMEMRRVEPRGAVQETTLDTVP